MLALPALAANTPPKITGPASTTVTVGQTYSFTPTVVDDGASTLKFVIKNRPRWLSFSYSTGRIVGKPGAADAKVYKDIQIFVDDGPNTAVGTKKFTITVTPPVVANRAPVFTSVPIVNATVGVPYQYTPTVMDADLDPLQFIVGNRPPWATFDTATGKLAGTPGPTDVGQRSQLSIAVFDGEVTVSQPFGIFTVHPAIQTAKVTLSWTPPTQNTDGSSLTNLAGYRIIYGASATALTQTITVSNAAISTYVIENLTSGKWYFAVVAYNSAGAESVPSNIASKTLS
jgi:hypothetical protein